jgi:orotidine-5'-phosphate decarboxylase
MSFSKIALALDLSSQEAVETILQKLNPKPKTLKIGLELTSAIGVREAVNLINKLAPESNIFLDLKLHDIPNTVAHAISSLNKLADKNVRYITLHALGGRKMLSEAHKAAAKEINLVAVTLLTSHSALYIQEELGLESIEGCFEKMSLNLVKLSQEAGLSWIVASALECKKLKSSFPSLKVVTPGIRPAGSEVNDQQRVVTPKIALEAGSDLLVIGRPIYAAPDPQNAWKQILG